MNAVRCSSRFAQMQSVGLSWGGNPRDVPHHGPAAEWVSVWLGLEGFACYVDDRRKNARITQADRFAKHGGDNEPNPLQFIDSLNQHQPFVGEWSRLDRARKPDPAPWSEFGVGHDRTLWGCCGAVSR